MCSIRLGNNMDMTGQQRIPSLSSCALQGCCLPIVLRFLWLLERVPGYEARDDVPVLSERIAVRWDQDERWYSRASRNYDAHPTRSSSPCIFELWLMR